MSKTRNTGFLTNVVQYNTQGDITFVSGSTTLLTISSSGEVITTGVISGSNALSSSYSVSSSQAENAALLDNLDSTSFVYTSSFNSYSSSVSVRVSNLESTASVLTSASASFAVVSASYASASGSIASRVTKIEGNYATTGSNAFNGSQNITGSLTVSQAVIAQTLNVQQVTSSIVYSCGSNIFGCAIGDVQQMTGSVRITGSLNTTGTICSTGNTCFGGMSVIASCLGIGTTSPSQKLEVYGSIAIGQSGTNDIIWGTAGGIKLSRTNVGPEYALSQAWDGTCAYIDVGASSQWNGGVRILPNGGGNVGIGTSTPSEKLDICIASTTKTATLRLNNSCYTPKSYFGVLFDNLYITHGGTYSAGWSANGTNALSAIILGSGNADSSFSVQTIATNGGGSGPCTRLIINKDGIACFACQVCAPAFVGGTVSGTSATISNTGTACTVTDVLTLASQQTGGSSVCAGAGILFTGNAGATVARIYSRGNMNFNNGSDLVFQTQVSAGGTPQCTMVINGGSQNVGIGTFTPTDKLDIYGNDTNGAIVVRGGSSQTGRNVYLFSGGINATGTLLGVTKCVNQFIYANNSRLTIGTADAHSLGFSTSDTLRAIIDSSGIACFACQICAPSGVKFGNGSSTLNYYEQGTWTPRVTNGSFTTNAGTENAGWYVRVGNIVTVGGTLSWSGGSGAQDGNSLQIRCLPFTANSGTSYRNVGQFGAPAIDSIGFKNACAQMTLVIDPGNSYIYIIQNYQNGTYLTYTHSPCMANAGTVYGFQATYQV